MSSYFYGSFLPCEWSVIWMFMAWVQQKLHLLFLWQSSLLFMSSHVASYNLYSFQGRICPHGCVVSIQHFFSGRMLLPLSLKHMDGLYMLFTCHWHDDCFEKCCARRFVHVYVIACVLFFDLAEMSFFISNSQLIQSWHVHLQFQLTRNQFTSALLGHIILTRGDPKKKEAIQDQWSANGIARKKPFKNKCPCQTHLGTGKLFGMNTDGTAIYPPKAFVERTIIGKGESLWIWLWKKQCPLKLLHYEKAHYMISWRGFASLWLMSVPFDLFRDTMSMDLNFWNRCVLHVVSHFV